MICFSLLSPTFYQIQESCHGTVSERLQAAIWPNQQQVLHQQQQKPDSEVAKWVAIRECQKPTPWLRFERHDESVIVSKCVSFCFSKLFLFVWSNWINHPLQKRILLGTCPVRTLGVKRFGSSTAPYSDQVACGTDQLQAAITKCPKKIITTKPTISLHQGFCEFSGAPLFAEKLWFFTLKIS